MARYGDALHLTEGDGVTQVFDFSPLPDGAVLPADAVSCEYIVGEVTRVSGQIHLTVLLPIAWDAPYEACFPAPIIDPPDGAIALPGATHVD